MSHNAVNLAVSAKSVTMDEVSTIFESKLKELVPKIKILVLRDVEADVHDELVSRISGMEKVSPKLELHEVMNLTVSHAIGSGRAESEIRQVDKSSI